MEATGDRDHDVPAANRPPGGRREGVAQCWVPVAPTTAFEAASGEVVVDVIRHYGTRTPSGEVQKRHMDGAVAALRTIGVDPTHVAHRRYGWRRYTRTSLAYRSQ